MNHRDELHEKLCELFGSRNVYYKPPANVKMVYPAIRYTRKNFDIKRADNSLYLKKNCYEIVVISKDPDHPVIEKLLGQPYSSFDRSYVMDNLYHDVITLYY